jgi:ornithine--oxo-acid transaminase
MFACSPNSEYANDDKNYVCHFLKSIRFSPPLVISEEDLQKSIGEIRQALIDLDEVRLSSPFCFALCTSSFLFVWQFEEIPGEVESEKGFRDEISN